MGKKGKTKLKELKIVLAYRKISLEYENMTEDEVKKEISLLETRILKNEEKKYYNNLVKKSFKQDQSISEFSEEDQKKLISMLKLLRNKPKKSKGDRLKKVTISEKTIQMERETGWETIRIIVLYDNLEDIETYKLASYYYDYDYASDPPFESKPAETKGILGEALSFLIDTCKEIINPTSA